MAPITETARKFFEACETGKGWDGCKAFCQPDATFSAQAEPLRKITRLDAYCDWMKAAFVPMPNAHYDLKAFAADEERQTVLAFAVFKATHTHDGGPVPPTGKSMTTDYVYAMRLSGGKVSHLTKVWHSGLALKDLGWV
ncbi:MAG: nuclear transport factor 2 family protein [Hyphomicrobiaceae bacterium]